jgi:polysaccharide export outer membrane protein
MRNALIIFSVLFMALNFTSCRSTKDITVMQDMTHEEFLKDLPGQAPEYRIKTDDNLFVEIQSLNPEVSQLLSPGQSGNSQVNGVSQNYGQLSSQYLSGYLVDKEGTITLPLLGKITVAGNTVNEALKMIETKTREYVKDATVKVKLLSYKITVMGEVRNPGVYYNYSNSITIFEALSMASGITDFASIKRVLVMRPTADGTKSFRIDLTKKDLVGSTAYYLLPNDMVYVTPDNYKYFGTNSQLWSMSLSAITTALLVYQIFK